MRLEVEVDPGVDAPLAEVPVEGAVVAVLLEELAEVAEVIAELDRDGRPSPPSLPRHPCGRGSGPWRPAPTRGPSTGAPPRPRRRRASSRGRSTSPLSRAISALALSSASSLDSPPNSTSSQPPPGGSSLTSLGWIPLVFMSLTRMSSSPSRPIGLASRISGTCVGRPRRRPDSPGPAATASAGWGPGGAAPPGS